MQGGFDLRRTGPVPHPALAPGGVRQLGSTCELRSRHGHRLALRSLRIFLPAACSPLLPLGLALPPARAEASGEEPGLPTPCRQAAAGWPEAQAHSAGPWGRTTPQVAWAQVHGPWGKAAGGSVWVGGRSRGPSRR